MVSVIFIILGGISQYTVFPGIVIFLLFVLRKYYSLRTERSNLLHFEGFRQATQNKIAELQPIAKNDVDLAKRWVEAFGTVQPFDIDNNVQTVVIPSEEMQVKPQDSTT